MKQTKAPETTPTPLPSDSSKQKVDPTRNSTAVFVSMGLDMSWRLALSILIPVIVGVQLGKAADNLLAGVFAGLALAVVFAVVTIRRTVTLANNHPVLNGKEAK